MLCPKFSRLVPQNLWCVTDCSKAKQFGKRKTNAIYICSLNWQHQLCKSPKPNPDIKTLFVDHSCGQPNGASTPSQANNPLLGGAVPKPGGFPPLAAHVV